MCNLRSVRMRGDYPSPPPLPPGSLGPQFPSSHSSPGPHFPGVPPHLRWERGSVVNHADFLSATRGLDSSGYVALRAPWPLLSRPATHCPPLPSGSHRHSVAVAVFCGGSCRPHPPRQGRRPPPTPLAAVRHKGRAANARSGGGALHPDPPPGHSILTSFQPVGL